MVVTVEVEAEEVVVTNPMDVVLVAGFVLVVLLLGVEVARATAVDVGVEVTVKVGCVAVFATLNVEEVAVLLAVLMIEIAPEFVVDAAVVRIDPFDGVLVPVVTGVAPCCGISVETSASRALELSALLLFKNCMLPTKTMATTAKVVKKVVSSFFERCCIKKKG